MLGLDYTNKFKKDLKQAKKRGRKISKLNEIINLIKNEKSLPE